MTLEEIDTELEAIREALVKQTKTGRSTRLETGRGIERTDHDALVRRESQLVRRRNALIARSAGAGSLGGIVSRVR